jgi:hypothetical protein
MTVLMAVLRLLVLRRALVKGGELATMRATYELAAGHIGAEVVWRDCARVLCRG